jgi:hypothetical protein
LGSSPENRKMDERQSVGWLDLENAEVYRYR